MSFRTSKKSLDFTNSRRMMDDSQLEHGYERTNSRQVNDDEDSVLELGQIALLSSSKRSLRYRSGTDINASRAENISSIRDEISLAASKYYLDANKSLQLLSKDDKGRLEPTLGVPEPIVEETKTCLKGLDEKCLPLKGYIFGILSAMLFCLSQIIMRYGKWLTGSDHSVIRYLVTFVIMFTIIKYKNLSVFGPKKHFKLLMFRGFIGSCALLTMSFAFMFLNPSDSTTLSHTSMIITGVLARIILKEKLTIAHFVALVLTVVGVIFISKPSILFPNKPVVPSFRQLRMSKLNKTSTSFGDVGKLPSTVSDLPNEFNLFTNNLHNYTLNILDQYGISVSNRNALHAELKADCEEFSVARANESINYLSAFDSLIECYNRSLVSDNAALKSIQGISNFTNNFRHMLSSLDQYRSIFNSTVKAQSGSPDSDSAHMQLIMGVIFALLGASASSCVYLALKKLCNSKIHWSTTTIYICWLGVPLSVSISSILIALGHSHKNFQEEKQDLPMDVFYSICSALLSIGGQVTLNIALKYEDATKIALTKTTDVLFSIALQFFLLNIKIDSLGLLGALCILSGTFFVLAFKLLENKYELYKEKQLIREMLLTQSHNTTAEEAALLEKKPFDLAKFDQVNTTVSSPEDKSDSKAKTVSPNTTVNAANRKDERPFKELLLKLIFFKV